MVVIWHALGVANEVYEATYNKITYHTEVQPLQIEFDINEKVTVEAGSGKVSYTYFSHMVAPAATPPNTEIFAQATGTTATQVGGTGGRNLQLCDPDLTINDPFACSLANTFDLRMESTISPVTVTTKGPAIVPPPFDLPVAEGFQFWLHYDPEKSTNQGLFRPTTLPENVYSALMPPPAGTPINLIKYTIDYTLTTKQLELRYSPVNQDMRNATGAYAALRGITVNLAKDEQGGSWFVHANNQIKAFVEGQDSTSSFILWRRARVWEAPLGSGDAISGGYTAAAGIPGVAQWVDDNTDRNPLNFIDIPGPASLGDPSKWSRKRSLFEFVSSIDKFPEFGFIYYIVVIDLAPNSWRVRMYRETKITLDQWCAYKASKAPQSTEDSSQPTSDTGWRDMQGNAPG